MVEINDEINVIDSMIIKFKDDVIDALNDKITLLEFPFEERDTEMYKKTWQSIEDRLMNLNITINLLEKRKKELLGE